MLVELAIGDAYGVAFEYAPDQFVAKENDGQKYRSRRRIDAGRYSDDTQMAIGIAELILADAPWDTLTIARKFVEVFKRDERMGYARNFYHLLKEVKSGDELLAKLKPESDKSGGAMRAPPIGIYPSIELVKERAAIQASVTHNTPAGIAAACASALMTHYFIYRLGPKKDLAKFIAKEVGSFDTSIKWAEPYTGPVGAKGWMSVRAAITALMSAKSETELLQRCVAFTGDVDTVAAIGMAAGNLCDEIELNLSQQLIDGLENGSYGFNYLYDLDAKLGRRSTSFQRAPATAPECKGWTLPPPPPVPLPIEAKPEMPTQKE